MTFIFVVNYSSARADQMKETPIKPCLSEKEAARGLGMYYFVHAQKTSVNGK